MKDIMLEKLFKLRREWQQAFPKRAAGGISALAGFDYQLGVFLLNLLEKWSKSRKNKDPMPSPKTFLESISDIADISSNGILYKSILTGADYIRR